MTKDNHKVILVPKPFAIYEPEQSKESHSSVVLHGGFFTVFENIALAFACTEEIYTDFSTNESN